MKNLKFNFEEGKQRVIDMLKNHISDFERDMMCDVKIVIDRAEPWFENKTDVLEEVEEIIETARMNRNYAKKAIVKVQNTNSIIGILAAMENTVYEEMEETVLNELFGLKSITIG